MQVAVLFLFMMLGVFSSNIYAGDKTQLQTDANGNYLIYTEEDFNTFVSCVNDSSERFKNEKVILCSDLNLSGISYSDTGFFGGVFDGKNHTINYEAKDIDDYVTETSVFPFVFTDGKLKDVKVNIDQCNISETCDLEEGTMPHDVGILGKGALNSEIEGVQLKANSKIVFWGGDICGGFNASAFETIQKNTIKNCSVSINYDLADEQQCTSIVEAIKNQTDEWGDINDLALYQLGNESNAFSNTYENCYSAGSHGKYLQQLAQNLKEWNTSKDHTGVVAKFIGTSDKKSSAKSCFFDSTLAPELRAVCNSRENTAMDNEDTFAKTTEQMKQQSTYEGFDFAKKWSVSPDVNDGYPYYDPKAEQVILKVKPVIADKEWNTANAKDKNKYGKTDTYYYPYYGDDDGTVTGVEFTDLTKEQQEYVTKYGISVSCDPKEDVESAKIDMNFLGSRPVKVIWKNQPTMSVAKADLAEEDGYKFAIETVDGTAKVVENTASGISEDQWDAYYQKAKEAIQVIMKYCENKNNFGPKDSPSYENSEIWSVFTAARCGYVPYGDNSYFDKWFANTKKYLQNLKDNGVDFAKETRVTDLAKLALAIEAAGYDLRDISSVDLLTAVGTIKDSDEGLFYKYEYMIHAIKAGGYSSTSASFTDEDMKNWALKRADSLKQADDSSFVNADNSMGWQPLVYWYDDPDVKAAIDSAEKRYPIVGQRATGAFCTEGFETQCPTFGNNAWNNAQAMLFAGEFNVNVLDYASGYTKNGNNILDAVFDQINFADTSYSDSTIPGFYNYDPAQIARGLDSVVRSYERNIKNEEVPAFWVFSDVTVQTRKANDLILALDDNSTKAQITAARIAYDELDDAHKAIFNKDTLKKLMDAEGKGEAIEKVVKAIDAIPAADQLTLEDKKTVEKARTLYDALDAESQAAVSNYSKLTEAEEKIAELEEKQAQETADKKAAESVSTAIASLPTAENLTLSDYVLKRLDEVQAAYDALTETQKALVENYETLQTLRTVAADKKAAAEVAEKISAIGTLNAGNHEQKQALVTEARTAYEGLTEVQKSYVANYGVLEKAELFLSTCEKDEQAAYVMGVIDELNTVSKTMADGPLKLTEKNNGVPTEEIWKDWENYVVNARAQYTALDASQQEQVENLSDLEAAEGYVYQVKAETLKAQLEALPDATTVKGYEAQPTETPETPETTPAPESPAETAEFDADAFSDGSTDAAVETQNAEVQDVFSAEESGVDTDDTDATVQDADVVSAEVQNETGVDVETATAEKTAGSENTAVTADAENEATETAEAVAEDTENADAIPAADSTSAPAVSETDTFSAAESEEADTPSTDFRALTDEELVQIITAKNSYEQLATAEEEKFRAENTALVENLEKLVSLALTYPSAEETYLQQFTAEAAQLYTSVNPVSRDTYAAVKALLDRYEKDYQSYADAMASLKAEVNGQELTFAELLNSLKEQTAKVEKDTADAAEADERILNLPTAVTKDNIHEVEAELASLQKFLDNMSEEARTYMWQKSQLTLVRTIVADYHVDLADKKDTFKSSRPKNLKTKVLNYKTIQVSWTGTDYADSYNVYRKTGTGSWKKIASGITGVSYKDTKAVTGTTYTYTVRAVSYTWGKAVLSKYDQTGVKGKAKLTAPTFTSVKTAGKNTVKATWKKVTGASGYRVYRSTSKNGKYTSAGLIKKGSTVTFKDKKVSKGKTYYYKVRAYRTVNGKRVYGPYSTVKSVKAK